MVAQEYDVCWRAWRPDQNTMTQRGLLQQFLGCLFHQSVHLGLDRVHMTLNALADPWQNQNQLNTRLTPDSCSSFPLTFLFFPLASSSLPLPFTSSSPPVLFMLSSSSLSLSLSSFSLSLSLSLLSLSLSSFSLLLPFSSPPYPLPLLPFSSCCSSTTTIFTQMQEIPNVPLVHHRNKLLESHKHVKTPAHLVSTAEI